jgi:CheY-like chemotaxis protein
MVGWPPHWLAISNAQPDRRALVIDDDTLVRESLSLYLSPFGYDVRTAASQDVHGEHHTGIDVVRRLREASRRPLPAVNLTAEVGDEAREAAPQASSSFVNRSPRKPCWPR